MPANFPFIQFRKKNIPTKISRLLNRGCSFKRNGLDTIGVVHIYQLMGADFSKSRLTLFNDREDLMKTKLASIYRIRSG